MVKIAVFSDVHGNAPALRAVLARIEYLAVDVVINLGDIASGGVDPRGTFDLLRSRPDIVTIRGNHERQLLTLPEERLGASDRLACEQWNQYGRQWLQGLPTRCEPVEGVLAFHGSPDDDLCYLLHTVDSGLREATDDEVLARLGPDRGHFRLYLCGHTHLQRTRHLPNGAFVVNPGSVGWPAYEDDNPSPHAAEAGTAHARFSVISSAGDGNWRTDEHTIDYDVEAAVALALRNARPDVAYALRTGHVPSPP